MRENRRKRNQISEMSFPRYEKANRGENKKQNTCKISGFCLGVDDTFVPMSCYIVYIDSCLLKFQDRLSALSSRSKHSMQNVCE
jgi:hypothetical protein